MGGYYARHIIHGDRIALSSVPFSESMTWGS